MKPYVRQSKYSDALYVARYMRESDVREIWRSHRSEPLKSLEKGLNGDCCMTFMIDGEPVAMFGVTRTNALSSKGVPWLLGTEKIRLAMRYFLTESKNYVAEMNRHYPMLENYIDPDNKLSVRWLQWLGFNLKETVKNVYGHDFIRFERRA